MDDEQIDTDATRNIEHFQCVLGHEHAIARLAQRLFNEFLHRRALLDDHDRRASCGHAATFSGTLARDQTQMG
jgi:hypothetical protein